MGTHHRIYESWQQEDRQVLLDHVKFLSVSGATIRVLSSHPTYSGVYDMSILRYEDRISMLCYKDRMHIYILRYKDRIYTLRYKERTSILRYKDRVFNRRYEDRISILRYEDRLFVPVGKRRDDTCCPAPLALCEYLTVTVTETSAYD